MSSFANAKRFSVVDFEDAATIINARCAAHKRTRGLSPFENALGQWKREAYTLVRGTINRAGGHNIIKTIIRSRNVTPDRLLYAGNEFYWGLLAIDPFEAAVTKKDISIFSRQMAYADLHSIAPHFLVGFLYQSGSPTQITRKLKEGYREPWFKGPRK